MKITRTQIVAHIDVQWIEARILFNNPIKSKTKNERKWKASKLMATNRLRQLRAEQRLNVPNVKPRSRATTQHQNGKCARAPK